MREILERLIGKLGRRGLTDREVPWLLRDVLNIVNSSRVLTLEHLNRKLYSLGWDHELLDGHALELLLCLIEDDVETAPREQTLH